MSELFVGLMSGTSLDGIDAVLVDFSDGVQVVRAETFPFDPALQRILRALIEQPRSTDLDTIGLADAELGIAYAKAAGAVVGELPAAEIRAVGCHGQTIRHKPDASTPFTWQLGDPNRVAAALDIPVVADFRRIDMALGGQGAPLVPAFHAAVFGSENEQRVIVNIGGIANITRLTSPVTGYDTGPGNGLMDAWIQRCKSEPFDRDGDWARSGQVDRELLDRFFSEPWLGQEPPRSTGRELFNLPWLLKHVDGYARSDADVQATLMAFTAESIARETKRAKADRVIVCGGGARNNGLLTALRTAMAGVPVETSDEHGLNADFVEATAFAWLARERLAGRPGNLVDVTGAKRPAILGAIYHP